MRRNMRHMFTAGLVVGTVALGLDVNQARAQDLPSDSQVQAAFGVAFNHLGLIQCCAAKKLATVADVANTRKVVDATVAGLDVRPAARAQQAVGQPTQAEMVAEGQTISSADNARAQHTSERTLCRQMAAQAARLR